MAGGVHEGHRERLKARFLKSGLDSFNSHQVLELLLFYAIPRKDTNPLAHELLDTFGGLPEVLDASVEELCRVKGISEHSATLIVLCGQLLKRYHSEKRKERTKFTSIDSVGEYLFPMFLNERCEKAVVLCLNNRWELLGCTVLSTGTLTGTEARAREIIEIAMKHQATNVILAHNHPAGFAMPSGQDISTTRYLRKALKLMDLTLLDHLIFSPDDFTSFRQSPRYSAIFSEKIDLQNL